MDYFYNIFLDCDGEQEIKTYFIYHAKNGRYYERIHEERRRVGDKHFNVAYDGKIKRISEKAFVSAWETYKNA